MSPLHILRLRARAFLALAIVAAIATATACGGGVGAGGTGLTDDGGDGSGGGQVPLTGPGFAQGPVTGLKPFMVDGVQFKLQAVQVSDDDGNVLKSKDLALGMDVMVLGTIIIADASRGANVYVHTDLVGLVTAPYDARTHRLGVLGQIVQVDADTHAEDIAGGAAGLAAGDGVVVSALVDPSTGIYLATRLARATPTDAFATRGAVADLDTAGATFRIGTQVFDYAGVPLPALFGNGQIERVRTRTTPTAAGHWVVTAFQPGVTALPNNFPNGRILGIAGDVLFEPTYFYFAGLPVDASAATFSPAGAPIAPGMRLDVHGVLVNGILHASEVDVPGTD